MLDREAREVELQEMEAGMGTLRRSMLARERAAMYAEDKALGHYQAWRRERGDAPLAVTWNADGTWRILVQEPPRQS